MRYFPAGNLNTALQENLAAFLAKQKSYNVLGNFPSDDGKYSTISAFSPEVSAIIKSASSTL